MKTEVEGVLESGYTFGLFGLFVQDWEWVIFSDYAICFLLNSLGGEVRGVDVLP